jgi:ribulose-5-phosphate 4-epimerase/fuculose-1-phosphate aldolase
MLETICDVMRDAYARNWITSRDGNVSIRHHDRDHFYITPSGVRKQTLQPDQFKKIKIEFGYYSQPPEAFYSPSVLPYTEISAKLQPSGELPLHFGLQKQLGQHSGDVRVVVHVHPTYCIAAMHAGIDLSTISSSFPELNLTKNQSIEYYIEKLLTLDTDSLSTIVSPYYFTSHLVCDEFSDEEFSDEEYSDADDEFSDVGTNAEEEVDMEEERVDDYKPVAANALFGNEEDTEDYEES